MRAAQFMFGGACAAIAASGCAPRHVPIPLEVSTRSAVAMPTPRIAGRDEPPQLLKMRFSSLVAPRGHRWTGNFVTSTNVASVEVRTNLFSIDVPHMQPGLFGYALDVFDVPTIFIRKYRLRVIARNSAGLETERDLPFEIR